MSWLEALFHFLVLLTSFARPWPHLAPQWQKHLHFPLQRVLILQPGGSIEGEGGERGSPLSAREVYMGLDEA
jgi:hypothetical protein